jgi:hypothetical protein
LRLKRRLGTSFHQDIEKRFRGISTTDNYHEHTVAIYYIEQHKTKQNKRDGLSFQYESPRPKTRFATSKRDRLDTSYTLSRPLSHCTFPSPLSAKMHSFTNLALLALPLLASAATWLPTTTNAVPASVPTDIVPFAFLPSCAQLCGPLYDAQGACSPPAAKSVDKTCFCSYATLQPFRTGTLNVCSATTCSADPGGLLNIQQWFISYCGVDSNGNSGTATTTTTSTGSTPTSTSGSSTGGGGGGTSSGTKSQSWYVRLLFLCHLDILPKNAISKIRGRGANRVAGLTRITNGLL